MAKGQITKIIVLGDVTYDLENEVQSDYGSKSRGITNEVLFN
jgi:hypothetical protein